MDANRECTARHECRDNWNSGQFDQGSQLLCSTCSDHATADVEHGLLRIDDHRSGFAHLLGMWPGVRSVPGKVKGRGPFERGLCRQCVLGNVHQHGAGTPSGRQVECLGDRSGISAGSVISRLCLVIGIVMPLMSASLNASVPIAALGTWPVIATIGTESM